MIIVDLHADTLEKAFDEESCIDNLNYQFNVKDIEREKPYIQCLTSFVNSKYKGKMAYKRANNLIDKFYEYYNQSQEELILVRNKNNIEYVINNEKLGIVLTIENGNAINSDLKNVEKFYNRGIRIMSVTWNDDNELGSGAHTKNDIGLTFLGKQYIKELEKFNILVDVSHLSQKSFFDVCKIAEKPIIATHSCVNELCNHNRNLNDEQIKKIKDLNGLIGVCFYKEFLTNNKIARVKDIVNHIDYIANLIGIDYVGLGSDFDGISNEGLPVDLDNCGQMVNIINELKNRGYKKEDIEKIMGANFVRIMKEECF